MNLYFYWFFIIHGFYYSFSRDRHFDILAIGLFSLILYSLIFSLIAILFVLLGVQNLIFENPIPIIVVGSIIYTINTIIFLPKRRQENLMAKFRRNQSITKDILSIILTAFSIISFVVVTVLNAKIK